MISFRGKIPISIHPFFWVIAVLIGWLNSPSFLGIILWVFIILISVLFHELGHALTAKLFGLHPRIDLIAMGGVTQYEGKNLKFYKQFLIVLNGPVFGILLFLLSSLILYLDIFKNIYILSFFKITQVVNLFWTIINLLPVLPLDGGQLLRIILEGIFGIKGFKISLFIGTLIALLLSVFFFIRGAFLIGALFFLFAFQSFESWRKSRFVTKVDRDEKKADSLKEGEKAFREGRKSEAKAIFKKIREETKQGILYSSATYFLALIKLDEDPKESYDLLLEIKDYLTTEAKCILHDLAFKNKNYQLVADLSAICYQVLSSYDVAMKNAKAFAYLKKSKEAGGWLQTLLQYDNANIDEILKEEEFLEIKKDPEFKKFFP